MGLLDKGKQKAIDNQTESIRKEAAGFGSQITEIIDLLEDEGAAGVVRGMKNALLGGKTKASAIQQINFQNRHIHHTYFQPYQGLTVLPGEHHILIDGSVPVPVCFEKSGLMGKKKWIAPANENIAQSMNTNGDIGRITAQLKWEWPSGLSKIDLTWTLQLRPTGDGRTHIVLLPGRYGGFTTYHVGFGVFLNAAATFMNMLKNTGPAAEGAFVHETAFGGVFFWGTIS